MDTFIWFSRHWTGSKADLIKLKAWSDDWDRLRTELHATESDRQRLTDGQIRAQERQSQPRTAASALTSGKLVISREAPAHRMAAYAKVLAFPGAQPPQPTLQKGTVCVMPALAPFGQDGVRLLLIGPVRPDAPFGNWHVIPFSPLSQPATDEEWQLDDPDDELAEAGCSVLCFWNHFQLPAPLLERAEPLLTLSPEEAEDIRELWHVYQATATLPPGRHAGASLPGLLENDDPRAAYYAHCYATQPWQHLIPLPQAFRPEQPPVELQLAATVRTRPSSPPPPAAALPLHDSTDILHLRLEGRILHLVFRTETGETARQRDGSLLITPEGWMTRFQSGSASTDVRRLRQGFMLMDPQGHIIPVELD